MNAREAIKYWKVFLKEIAFLKREHSSVDWEEQERATKMAIEALEKQDAKKYKTFVGESGIVRITYYECPCCGEIGIEHMQKHCHECGQKLDWSD